MDKTIKGEKGRLIGWVKRKLVNILPIDATLPLAEDVGDFIDEFVFKIQKEGIVNQSKETITEEMIRLKVSVEEITECNKLKTNLYVDEFPNYWEGKHHFIPLEQVIFIGKKYEDEIVVFLKDVPPQVYPLIKGMDEVNSFLKQFRIYKER